MSTTAIGPIVSQWALETAVISTISTWLETYLSAVERGVWGAGTSAIVPRPGAPAIEPVNSEGQHSVLASSIYGGVDFLTTSSETMPNVIVNIVPNGNPQYFGSGDYTIEYELEIASQCYGQDETLSRMYALLYGSAVTALILQNGELGGIATRTRLTAPARAEFMDTQNADDNYLVQAIATFAVYIDSAYNDQDGIPEPVTGDTLPEPNPSQLPPGWPTVEAVDMAIQILKASANVNSATFTGPDVIQVSE